MLRLSGRSFDKMSKTVVIEGRLDMRDLATCADYMIKSGISATSRSDLLYKVVASFAQAAIEQGALEFESTESALAYLNMLGFKSLNRPKRPERMANSFTLSKVIGAERGVEASSYSADIEQNELEEALKLFNNNQKKED
jgi:hypothetical protein